ncbi:MAG TPA: sigma factor-like helix-turn-helix DNA-binding protein [Herpetosiphonaceae bacterium]
MTHRVGMSQVKFKVRYHALLLREFTVADIVSATGLNPESVRTELQRMRQDGLLKSETQTGAAERHGRASLYRLTDDPEARLTLSRSVEAFYPPPPPSTRPTSRHYQLAQQLLDQALNTTNSQRHQLLDDAQSALEMAEQAEYDAHPEIKAYFEYERARLAYLRGEYTQAEQTFTQLRDRFGALHDQALLRRIEEFLVCVDVQRRFAAQLQPSANEATLGWSLAQALVEQDYQTDSPITSLLLLVLRQLSETASDKVSAAVRKDTAEDTRSLLADETPDSQRHIVGKAITNLPPEQQQVIALKFFIGLSTREIAETLGRTEATIKALQHRAINRLQHLLVNERLGSAS